jgi:hypothetical protein
MTNEKAKPEPLDPEIVAIVDALAGRMAREDHELQKQQTAQGAQICAGSTGSDHRP